MVTNQKTATSYVLEANPIGVGWKLAQMWWLIPKRYILKKFTVNEDLIELEMWNGNRHLLKKGFYQAILYKDSKQGDLRTVKIKTNDNIKVWFREIVPMYPNKERDFDTVLEHLGAQESKISKVMNVIENLTERVKKD